MQTLSMTRKQAETFLGHFGFDVIDIRTTLDGAANGIPTNLGTKLQVVMFGPTRRFWIDFLTA